MKIISMGAGVQSSMMAVLAEEGFFGDKPDCAIFADTQWEPKQIYKHLEWLKTKLSYPIYTVSSGNLREDLINGVNSTGQSFITVPVFSNPGGMGRRQCTKEYKIEPVKKKIRNLLGVGYKQRVPKDVVVELWLGISTDEIIRMKDSRFKYIKHVFPLIDKKISRTDCLEMWNERFPKKELVKSACIGCPYRPTNSWKDMKENDQESWKDAVEVDEAIRNIRPTEVFLSSKREPLKDINFEDNTYKVGEVGFLEECDGMCDV